jgi:regulator of protease activity HflC (stomatin/prohibitin superfamily)
VVVVRVVVQEWERVLVYRDGRFAEALGPGAHRRPRWRRRWVRVGVRPRQLVVPTQEVLTADGLAVKATVVASLSVTDPRRWHEAVEGPEAFLYTALQVALRDAVTSRTVEEVLAVRGVLGTELAGAVAETAATLGAALDRVAVRDLVLPAELRHAASQVATARAQGLAVLERARAEVAATRALANAARLVTEQPALLQLRTLQAVEAGGATVVLSQGDTPVAVTAPGRARR